LREVLLQEALGDLETFKEKYVLLRELAIVFRAADKVLRRKRTRKAG
jgi:hypothetical protein